MCPNKEKVLFLLPKNRDISVYVNHTICMTQSYVGKIEQVNISDFSKTLNTLLSSYSTSLGNITV